MKTDAPKLGQLVEGEGFRDAIHIAVISGRLKESSFAGDEVGICSDGDFSGVMPSIGIIDPFLPPGTRLEKGDHVWVLLKPNSITGLRHVWHHPDIPDVTAKESQLPSNDSMSESEKWLRGYAIKVNPYIENAEDAFRKLIGEAKDHVVFFYGSDCHGSKDVEPDFFHHISVYLGKRLDEQSFSYTCSC